MEKKYVNRGIGIYKKIVLVIKRNDQYFKSKKVVIKYYVWCGFICMKYLEREILYRQEGCNGYKVWWLGSIVFIFVL